ncbi:DNA-3-methyladenine glycosylase 2 family protein [Castellaniella sp.]|uniref:DNA-3-methyladenine glycosylase family protein n=1 Tax=Castellaniella sp. TaxID=1955812 RepID=UPI002AFF75BA|nr:DNA-3-methyladenine glycosylase 2 family protein [Castellaniella sp.]
MSYPESVVQRPVYWAQACQDLMQRDRILRKLIPVYGQECVQAPQGPYQTLIRIIVGQQISLALGRKLWRQLVQACGQDLRPDCILRHSESDLRAMGLSLRKAQYVRDAARYFQQDQYMDLDWWQAQDDAAIVARLCEIRGVGRWSAEMFLVFSLRRPDVLPLDDTALLKAISHHYFSGEPVSRFEAREVAQAWAPWRTVASWYLWRSMDAAAVEY